MQKEKKDGFRNILFPTNFEYSSDSSNTPLDFYLNVFPLSVEIELKLGYFSSKALAVLSYGFANFIYNGGVLKIITNHFLYAADKEIAFGYDSGFYEFNLNDLTEIKNNLTKEEKHFFNCLKFLAKLGRLELVPVMLKPGRMAHYKQGVFTDAYGDQIFIDGSCNFTASGLIDNGEVLSVFRSWGSDYEKNKVKSKIPEISAILSRQAENYEYIGPEKIVNAISSLGEDRDIFDILNEAIDILGNGNLKDVSVKKKLEQQKKIIEEISKSLKNEPRFPFNSHPREYQIDAYNRWVENTYQGIFAMATGTGKTITALNCLLEIYKLEGRYQCVVLVPGKALLEQWINEVRLFNFCNVIPASSDYPNWQKQLNEVSTALIFDKNKSFVVVTTYATFPLDKFQKVFNHLPTSTLLIADEAHNIGSKSMLPFLEKLHLNRRIALSATPTRQFDPEGNSVIEKVFNSPAPYTYSYSMRKAIETGVLCRYKYYPSIVYLDDEEFLEYKEISKKLLAHFDQETKTFNQSDYVQKLLIQRKSIIHKAKGKLDAFRRIIKLAKSSHSSLSNSLVYVPEGIDENDEYFMDKFLRIFEEELPELKAMSYTSESQNREEIIDFFESGFVDTLFSMKCLDEGVDIPRAQIAVFCSSTGNPRQFIQRRGRVLRKHPKKDIAYIYDLIVIPCSSSEDENIKLEQKLIRDEMIRVIYFSSLSENYYEVMNNLQIVCQGYGLNIYAIQNDLESQL
jgi:superfamily II DNA or RNA helicase